MTTIAYDRPVADFISRLDATGHVSHEEHRKDKVTLHHNGGRLLSHENILSIWQVRPASAHFNVDSAGSCAQFVRVNEYAWATGSTVGNTRSISIEMSNQTVGPEWKVGEATWKSTARLAGWLFARVIGTRPTSDTLVVHHYWSSTECAGPYIDMMYQHVLWLAQQFYDIYASGRIPEEGEVMLREVNMGILSKADGPAYTLTVPSWHDKAALGLCVGFEDAVIEKIWFIGSGRYLGEVGPIDLLHDARQWWSLPDDTDQISILVKESNFPIGWSVDMERA